MNSINNFFTPESVSAQGSISMFVGPGESRKAFYLTNANHDKLLKLSIKSEPHTKQQHPHAQIKIIGRGIKEARVWEDKPGDPKRVRLPESVEMTYHGALKGEMAPKLHLKASSGYKTLINESLELPASTDLPLPLFALECGYKNKQSKNNPVTKKGHVTSTEVDDFVRIDFYLTSVNGDFEAFFNSMYLFSFLFNQEYLSAHQNHPLTGGQIIAPIELFRMGDYVLMVRRSISRYRGRPHFCFYSNKNYYAKMMNRKFAWKGNDGHMMWSTMAKEDERLRHIFDVRTGSNR